MTTGSISIDSLIDIVKTGGIIKTGVDVFNSNGMLLLEKDVPVSNPRVLEIIKENGFSSIPIDPNNAGGMWDSKGNLIPGASAQEVVEEAATPLISSPLTGLDVKILEIAELKREASKKYGKAKTNIKKVLSDIVETGGQFDYESVEDTVTDLLDFLTVHDNAFAHITKEIFSYDDYLYSHSTNVCTIGAAVLNRFNTDFSGTVNQLLTGASSSPDGKGGGKAADKNAFVCYQPEEIQSISVGYFLHDVGKVLIPDSILNKKGRLTEDEFAIIKKHSYEKGVEILEKNNQMNPFIMNVAKYHHSALFVDEKGCYPEDKKPDEIQPFVKICKIADMYDAMTSKRCYKDAFNSTGVMTDIFRKYVGKDTVLQHILHSFVKSMGICPPGSILYLGNGQMAYVIDSTGPVVLPFTDSDGKTLSVKPDPVDFGDKGVPDELRADNRRTIKNPVEVYDLLPAYLREMIEPV